MRAGVLLLALALPGRAAYGDGADGEPPAAEFLQAGVSARATGLAEAYSAVVDEASALYWNPAALTRVERRSVTVMHADHLGTSRLEYGAYAQRLGRAGALGASVQYMSAGELATTDELGANTGQLTPNDLALSLGYAYQLPGGWPGASIGAAVKYIRSSVVDSASGLAGDVGALSPALLSRRLRLAASLLNLGTGLRYGETREPLPLSARAGAAFAAQPFWTFSLEGIKTRGERLYGAVGTEYFFDTSASWTLAGRLGYTTRYLDDAEGLAGAAGGVGLAYRMLSVDYGLAPFGDVGETHRVSLSFRF